MVNLISVGNHWRSFPAWSKGLFIQNATANAAWWLSRSNGLNKTTKVVYTERENERGAW